VDRAFSVVAKSVCWSHAQQRVAGLNVVESVVQQQDMASDTQQNSNSVGPAADSSDECEKVSKNPRLDNADISCSEDLTLDMTTQRAGSSNEPRRRKKQALRLIEDFHR